MPLHPVVGRPDALQATGASLAAHAATRELPTAGSFARAAAAAAASDQGETAPAASAAAAASPADAGAPDAGAPAIQVQGLTFCYPDIGKTERGGGKNGKEGGEKHAQGRHRERETIGGGGVRCSLAELF